jgi:hypothetical protein
VLSFGGPPTFTPSAWEWSFRAAALLQSDRDRARSILEDGLRAHPEDPSLLYNLACAEALDGHGPAALGHLRWAIAGRPEVADWAATTRTLPRWATTRRFARCSRPDAAPGRQPWTPRTGSESDGVWTTQPDVESPAAPALPAAGNAAASASAIRCARAA